MKNPTFNPNMSIQEIGQRIERACNLCEKDFTNSVQYCLDAFNGHPLGKLIHLSMISSDLDFDYLRKIASEMKNWKGK